jgi:hypothetical protein
MSRFDQLLGSVGKRKPDETGDSPKGVDPEPATSASSKAKAKGKNPDYQRTTLYLPKDLHREFKLAALEESQEMSDIVEQLISNWLRSRNI